MQHPSRRQPGQHPHNRNREQNPFFEKVEAPRHDPKTALRTANLNHLMQAAAIDKIKLAEALEMDISRVGDYLEGSREFNQGVAQHVEEQVGLPSSWLDTRHQSVVVPERSLKILRGEIDKYADEEEPEQTVSTMTPVAVVTAPTAAQEPAAVAGAEVPEGVAEERQQDQAAPRIHVVAPAAQPRVEPVEKDVVTTVATPRPKVQKHSEVVIHTMANTTQEKEVTEMTISEDQMKERRRANFNLIAAASGAKAAIAEVMDVSPGHVTLLVQGKRAISEELARDIEIYFGLDKGWLDEKYSERREVPAQANVVLAKRKAHGKPKHTAERAPRRGRPRGSKNAATLQREATGSEEEVQVAAAAAPATARAEAPVAAKRGRKPGSVKSVPAGAKPSVQPELALEEQAAPPPAPAAAVVPAKPQKSYVSQPAPAVAHAPAAAASGELFAGMPAITTALLRKIVEKVEEGKLGDTEALRLLQEVVAL